jgi:cysteine-rich repeat protein
MNTMAMNKLAALVLLVAALATSSCRSRTYVLATVEVAPEVSAVITELQFVSSLVLGADSIAGDQRTFGGEGPISFPASFVFLADRRGDAGEIIEVFVEGYDASGATVARGRGSARVVAGSETVLSVMLRPHCAVVDDCLGGQAFCENPHACNCHGDDCSRGFCEAIDLSDGNSCTVTVCNEAERTATHEVLADGTQCENNAGETQQCAQGICKAPACGDFFVDVGEECDDGLLNSDVEPLTCRTDCTRPRCGDGIVDFGIAYGQVYTEACDEGANNLIVDDSAVALDADGERDERCRQSVTLDNGEGETLSCVLPFCGDGILNGDERCDDHNQRAGDACNPTCTLTNQVTTIAGSPGGPGHHDGVGPEARLKNVADFAVQGEFAYFTESGLAGGDVHTIRRVSVATGEVTTLAGSARGRADGQGAEARFDEPVGLAVDGDTLYIADLRNHSIRRLDLTTRTVETIAGTGSAGSTDGPAAQAQFNFPVFVELRSATELLVFDRGDCKLRQLDLVAQQVTTLAGNGCIPFGDNFLNVGGMVMGAEPSLFVTDENAIREVNLTDGTVTTVAGSLSTPGSADGDAATASFDLPTALVLDGQDLLIADVGNDALRKLDLTENVVSTLTLTPAVDQPSALGLAGRALLLGDQVNHVIWEGALDGSATISVSPLAGIVSPASEEIFADPLAVTMVPAFPGNLYVLNRRGRTVQRVSLATGVVSELADLSSITDVLTITGTGNRLLVAAIETQPQLVELTLSAAGSVAASAAHELSGVQRPVGLAVVGNHVYMTDLAGQRLARSPLDDLGATELVAGSGGSSAIVDGPLAEARFIAPTGAVVCAGRLYITETRVALESHVVREIDLGEGIVTTIAGFPTTRGHRDAADFTERSLFDEPSALACDDRVPTQPILYVTDRGNHTIRQIDLDLGRVTTLGGAPGRAVSIDGQGVGASFSTPQSIYFDPTTGDLLMADRSEGLVRRIR